MLKTQEFNFTPINHGDSVTIHEGGMRIDIHVSYKSIIDIVSQLNDEEKWGLIQATRSVG